MQRGKCAMSRRSLMVIVLSAAALSSCDALQPASVSRAQFQQLGWLIGTWRGSGGEYPAFFEEYRLVNDSTIRMRAFADSTLRAVSDSSTIEWRDGAVQSRGTNSTSIATEVTETRIRFVNRDSRRGYTFTQQSPDEWSATIDAGSREAQPTVYLMRRIQP